LTFSSLYVPVTFDANLTQRVAIDCVATIGSFTHFCLKQAAIKQYNAGCFYLLGASSPIWDKAHYFMRSYEGIKNRIAKTKKPYIFELRYNGLFAPRTIP
jgi:hypothetical protein